METAQAASQRQRSVRERRRERLKAWLCAASSCGRTSQRLLRGPCDCVLGEKIQPRRGGYGLPLDRHSERSGRKRDRRPEQEAGEESWGWLE
jgi:hypothetical protein